ncbi:efflux pump membrane transporter BepE-like [Teleopsis dalmanni]|uniref:efflux pump membrane transporter BepE-like n=1 Tax=Teleopsis dalmanni TaxID=139649 RepID=UPI0018CE1ABF|nr:efflux pump membrane transporter BepE-like [Teleopsis dalmanni]
MEELKKDFPPGVDYKLVMTVSKFLDASCRTRDWRSTLIPIIAVPVSLIGAFFIMKACGLTINLVTLFALVLAIGIVVDDAIVVVEAVHAKMEEKNLSPFKAVQEVMGEISGAIIAITAVMVSVFLPISFMSGPVGTFFRQFSITMASSIVISALIALTLTPVLCAMLLKNNHGKPKKVTLFTRFMDSFNRGFDKLTGVYASLLRKIVNRRFVTWTVLLIFCAGIFYVSKVLPGGFIPTEDQGTIYAIIQTPPGSTLEQTNKVSRALQGIAEKIEGVETVSSLAGYEIMTEGRGSNAGTCLINLKPWDERTHDKRKELTGVFTFFAANYPQYELVFDNAAAMQKGVSIGKAMDNLNILIGSTYDQGFIRFGQFFKVYVQASPEFRKLPTDVMKLYVKNDRDEMVPYSSFMTMKKKQGPNEITRYNMYNSAAIRGLPADGYTTADAIKAINETAAATLPHGYKVAWEGLSYDESRRGNEAIYIFIVVLVFVYLVLAAQYESFIMPLAVITSLPVGIFGSFFLLKAMGLENDIYAQVGLIMLVGLLGKNAVLIVEFAVQRRQEGLSIFEAAIEGAQVRFRPILMTSFAFVAGMIPLVLAHGAGAIGNHTIGASAMGGMIFGTVFGIIIIPGLYYIFAKWADGRKMLQDGSDQHEEEESPLSAACILIALGACKSIDIPQKEENKNVPESYGTDTANDSINTAKLTWDHFFTDPNLQSLIQTALQNNQELNITLQEVEISKNEIRAKKGEYLPSLGVKAGVGMDKVSRYTNIGAMEATTDIKPGKEMPDPLFDMGVGAYANWETDIWETQIWMAWSHTEKTNRRNCPWNGTRKE